MTSIKCTRTVKSGIALVVSLALFLTSAGWPATQAYAQAIRGGAAGESGAGMRGVVATPAALSGSVTSLSVRPSALAPSLGAFSAAPARASAPSAATAAAPAALPVAAAAASGRQSRSTPRPAAGKPVESPAPASAPDAAPAAEDPGPRWVKTSSSRVSLTSWVGRQVTRWTHAEAADSRKAFDGETPRAAAASTLAAPAAGARSTGLSKGESRADRIINDSSIPTPQAAREVGAIRRATPTPLWVKVVAPVSVVAAVAAAVAYGALPVLALGAGLVFSVLAHEVAHLAVLRALGDRTAVEAGNSLNPFNLVDAVKTVILPALSLAVSSAILPFPILLGAAKAVDVDFNNLRSPFTGARSARNTFWVTAAGPATNLALAGLAFGAAALLPAGGFLAVLAFGLAKMNLALTVFNLLPLPQLDGGKMLASALPERFYAKWVYDPKIEKSYQGLMRRIYEGPSNVLTFLADKLGITSQKAINRTANGVTFAALAAFYAVAYFSFSVSIPLLFLALPCTYDYWCIREKVRSEAAVNDIMQLYSEWAAVIAQIAEDKGMESEVSLFEAEHAMKNALETLVDEMMAKEEFRALSNEDKLAAVMKAYPDKAAEFLKEKVFTEAGDTLEKVKELLADPRNEAYMNRLRKWFEDHNIFERWDNPKYEGKLKDAMKEAGKEKGRAAGERGGVKVGVLAALAFLGGAAVLFPELAHMVPAWLSGLGLLGLAGTLSTTGTVPASPAVERDDSLAPMTVAVEFRAPLGRAALADFVSRVRGSSAADALEVSNVSMNDAFAVPAVRIRGVNAAVAVASVRAALDQPETARVSAPEEIIARLSSTDTETAADGWVHKLRMRQNGRLQVEVRFAGNVTLETATRIVDGYGQGMTMGQEDGQAVVTISAATVEEAAEIARTMAGFNVVDTVGVAPAIAFSLGASAASAPAETPELAAEAPAPALRAADGSAKIRVLDAVASNFFEVRLAPGVAVQAVLGVLGGFAETSTADGRVIVTVRSMVERLVELARTLVVMDAVETVSVSAEVAQRLGVAAVAPAAPRLSVDPSLPPLRIEMIFAAGLTEERVRALLPNPHTFRIVNNEDGSSFVRFFVDFFPAETNDAVAFIRRSEALPEVAGIRVSANLMSELDGGPAPAAAAPAADASAPAAAPKLSVDSRLEQFQVRVRFAADTAEERVAELISGPVHQEVRGPDGVDFLLGFMDEAQAVAHIRRLETLSEVATLQISPSLMRELDGTNAREAQVEAEAVDSSRWQGKVIGREDEHAHDVVITFKAGARKRAIAYLLKALRDQFDIVEEGDYNRRVKALRLDAAAEIARTMAGRKWVESVGVTPEVRDRVRSVALPAKVASHGKEHYSVAVVLVKFTGETTLDEIKGVLGHLGEKRLFRHGDSYVLNAGSFKDAAEAAKTLAENEAVAAVEVHPNIAGYLQDRMIRPYPDAEIYDPAQSLFVQFKSGTTEEQVAEYAALRHLRLVYAQFRGKEDLALFELPRSADATATRQMFVDETLDEGSIVAEVKPFKEQPGASEIVPSPAAQARVAARDAAAAAQAEAAQNPPRRDPAAEWLSYLQNRKMQDGTTLNDKQVKALSEFLRPLAKNPNEPRPPVVARTEEVKRMLPIVTSPRGMRNSVILVGEAGTGKTAVAEGLAEMIEDAEHAGAKDSEAFLQFSRLKGRWLVELDINKILTAEDPVGTLSAILDLLPRFNEPNPGRGNEVIVLMDEIQKFFLDNNGQKIANVLKGPLRDGKIAVIATTTRKEYKDYIEKDDAFRRRFEKIDVEEPTVEQTITILRALKGYLQKIHDAFIPDESLVAAAKLADQFDKTNFNPDKAIKAVQDGAELARPDNLRAAITLDVRETWNHLVVAVNEARQALMDKGIASTLALPIEAYNRIADLIKKAEALYAEREAVKDGKGQVTIDVVKRVIAQKTGIGSGQLNMGEEDAARFNDMEKTVGERVVNQEPALTAIANAIRRNKAGLSNPSRPMGKFLLTGPTGVGKTYLAKELARFLFKDPEAMIRMDMSEYMEEHTAQRLTGSPPGYVGYGEGGQLTEAVRKKPYSVILFDEVEKAHPKVFDVLLQILDDGRLTDGEGRTIDFKNTVIIMTSNAGMSTVDGEKYARMIEAVEKHNESAELRAKNIAEIEAAWDKEIDDAVNESLKSRFRPEFLNRLDEDPRSKNKWIRVNRLRRQDMTKIAQLQVKEFKDLLIDRHDTELVIDPSVIDFLTVEGFSPLYGARPMTAAIEKHIVDPMAKWILDEAAQGRKNVRGGLIKVKAEDGRIVFAAEAKPEKKLERSGVEGASRQTAAEVFALIERLVGEGEGEEPSEGLFDRMLRSARPAEPAAEAKTEASAATRAFFAPGSALSLPSSARTVAAAHNKPKAADAPVRAEIKAVTESVEKAGWDAAVVAAVSVPSGSVGEGWLKQFVSFAKGVAEKAGVAKPLEVSSAVSADAVRLAVSFEAELTEADAAFLAAHFTGTPPASYEAAQRAVDDLNLHSSIVRNHYLLDLYRRLRDIPGARMGYASASGRTQLWLEIRKEQPKPVDAPAAPSVAAAADGPATPHQVKEMSKLRGLLLSFIDQTRLQGKDQDGVSIRIAAAEAYARLAGPEEADAMRAWINERGWADGETESSKLGADGPMAMTAALVLQRLGTDADMELLEGVLRKSGDLYGDAFTPLKTAFVIALAEIYKRAGLKAARQASERAVSPAKGHELIKQAVRRSLGALGYPSDFDDIRTDSDALAQLYERMGRADELAAEFSTDAAWNAADTTRKSAILKILGRTGTLTPRTWGLLQHVLHGAGAGDRQVRYAAAQAWADLTARERLTKGLSAGIELYMNERSVAQDDETWAVMLAYVLALEKSGRADDLAALERLMKVSPEFNTLHYRHEQAYFAAPEAWAKIVIRTGKFAEYARPRMGEDGAPRPSILQEMLMNKGNPLLVAAALRAMAIARDASFKEKPVEPKGDAPNIHPGKKTSGGGGGYYNGGYSVGAARAAMYEERFGPGYMRY